MSANASAPGSLLWSADVCTGFQAQPILPNVTNSRVCGLQTLNLSVLQSCCNGRVETYACWSYCATDSQATRFSSCVNDTAPGLSQSIFCLSNSSSTIRQKSAGQRATKLPTTSFILLVACVFFAFFLGPTNARVINSLDNGLTKRASDSNCTFTEHNRFVQLGATERVSPGFTGFAGAGTPITTDITRNNRTINGTSAAEARYDEFFDNRSNQFGRPFPAMSSLEVFYEFVSQGSSVSVGWTPFQWCVNGTASGCDATLGDAGAMEITICGPAFVTDNNSTGVQQSKTDEDPIIQGTLGLIVSG